MLFLARATFAVYKSSIFQIFTSDHAGFIKGQFARYIFARYSSNTDDLEAKYKRVDDVPVTVNFNIVDGGNVEVSYLSVVAERTHLVAFLRKGSHVVVVIKLSTPLFMNQLLELLDTETPIILRPVLLSPVEIVNSFSIVARKLPHLFGDVDIVFVPHRKLTDDSLRNIAVNFPSKDFEALLAKASEDNTLALEAVFGWLTKNTTLKFEHLKIKSFASSVVHIERDRLTFRTVESDSQMDELLACLCEVIYSD